VFEPGSDLISDVVEPVVVDRSWKSVTPLISTWTTTCLGPLQTDPYQRAPSNV
jgi:hypothetical protein